MGGVGVFALDDRRMLLDDERVAGGDGFHLGVGERDGVHVFGATDARVAVHHLRDETRASRVEAPAASSRWTNSMATNLSRHFCLSDHWPIGSLSRVG